MMICSFSLVTLHVSLPGFSTVGISIPTTLVANHRKKMTPSDTLLSPQITSSISPNLEASSCSRWETLHKATTNQNAVVESSLNGYKTMPEPKAQGTLWKRNKKILRGQGWEEQLQKCLLDMA